MGGSEFMHKFKHYNWKRGVIELKAQADVEYGHQQGYSGQINSCDNIVLHNPRKTFQSHNQLWDYIQERYDNHLNNGDGEVIDLGISGYSIAKAVVKEFHGNLQIDFRRFSHIKDPAILLNPNGNIVGQGTLAELKAKAKVLTLNSQFEHDFYIVGKNTKKVYIATGEGKLVKSTNRKSDATTLVIPYHEYVVYGWARS